MTEDKKRRTNVVVDYTARDFEEVRERLMAHAKKYYPETYKDFSDLSFGSFLIDIVSYVGDQMSLFLDHSVNELFLPTATQYENVIKIVSMDAIQLMKKKGTLILIIIFI